RVILYGRSLGGGPATDLAAKEPVAGLVLESAFTSVFRVMTRWPLLPGDQFCNAKKLPSVKCPVLVMHGRLDEVIPFHHGETLLAAAPGKKSHLWVDGAGHNNLLAIAGDAYWQALLPFCAGL
ncbi:MAG TPA: alpha/beta hydrolase, partial [Candidatus Didemnitutus sp.]|nr:alpha/beta hydrolase [Candidatus Didemnitutus sp.]